MLMLIGMRAVAVAADATSGIEAGVEQQVRELALAGTQHAGAGVTRVDIQVGQLDARLRLAPCQHVEPYLPAGTRLSAVTTRPIRDRVMLPFGPKNSVPAFPLRPALASR